MKAEGEALKQPNDLLLHITFSFAYVTVYPADRVCSPNYFVKMVLWRNVQVTRSTVRQHVIVISF